METNSINIDYVVNEEVDCDENEKCVDIISEAKEEVEEICEPYAGMEFDSVIAYKDYYQTYANKKGFSQKVRSQERNEEGEVRFLILSCSCEGTYKIRSNKILKLRPTTKSGCKAMVRAIIGPDKVQITKAIIDHNHELSSPGKSKFYKKNRIITKSAKRRIENNDKADIRPYKSYNSFMTGAGGHDNVPFTQKDVHNHLEKLRRLRLGDGDAMALQRYFQKMQANNANFFYDIDLDDEGRLKNVFWADAWSRAAYKEFGDVITFDTTYLTNKYDMPFAPFVGVNHHGQSILFGCGLISSETIETFVWLFKSWLVCMNESAPTAIITDQDKTMKKAIEIVFPNTRHRWCIWHIMKKLPEKLSSYNKYEGIKHALQIAVYDSLTHKDFEEHWSYLIDNYMLGNNDWLNELYNEKRHWVPTFFKDTFWAGMSSTQRSESMNAFFDGYVNSKTTLKQFVEQYENALRSKVQKEKEADFNSFDRQIPCITNYPLEIQFQVAYTTSKFKEFQEEIKGKISCLITSWTDAYDRRFYVVAEDMYVGGKFHRRATFSVLFENVIDVDIKCNCQLFEFRGILCRHALTVLIQEEQLKLPEKYILRRWRKDVKRCHTKVNIVYSDWTVNPENERYDRMCNEFHELADLVIDHPVITTDVECWIHSMIQKVKNMKLCDSSPLGMATVVPNGKESDKIHDPIVVSRKGRRREKRLESKSKVEQVVKRKIVKAQRRKIQHGPEKASQVRYTTSQHMSHGPVDLNTQVDLMEGNDHYDSMRLDPNSTNVEHDSRGEDPFFSLLTQTPNTTCFSNNVDFGLGE